MKRFFEGMLLFICVFVIHSIVMLLKPILILFKCHFFLWLDVHLHVWDNKFCRYSENKIIKFRKGICRVYKLNREQNGYNK